MKPFGTPAASKCAATVGGSCAAVPAKKNMANSSSAMKTAQVTLCGYRAGDEGFILPAIAQGTAGDPWAPRRAVRRSSREIQAMSAKGAARGLDVRQIGERALGKPLGLVLHERARHQPGPKMGPGHELQRGFAVHGVNRNPEADVLPSFDIVIGLILMPRRRLPRAGFLREHVIVVEPGGGAAHEQARGFRQCRIEDEAPVARVVLPIAEILDKTSGIIRAARQFGARTQVGEILIDAGAKDRHFLRPKQLPDAHGAVALKPLDRLGVNHVQSALRISSRSTGPRYANPV